MEHLVASCQELKQEAERLKEEKEYAEQDLLEWKRNFENLEEESRKLLEDMKKELERKNQVIEDVSNVNEELKSYIDFLEKSNGYAYKGKRISDVKKKSRTLNCFLSRAKTALWFAESFGLNVANINVTEKTIEITHSVSLSESNNVPGRNEISDTESEKQKGFHGLSLSEKDKVEEILFLLDKFYVNDEFYHEVAMLDCQLPRSYLIKQRRDQLNKMCSISRLPGRFDGCEVDFEEILTKCLQQFVNENPGFDYNNSVRIKFSGDGAQMSRNTNFVILTVAMLVNKNDAMAAKGNHTLAVVKASEKYEVLKEACGNIFSKINNLNTVKRFKVGEKMINLELFFGGDYKFLLTVLGLQNATSNHSCIWCKIHRESRWDMSYNLSHYNETPLKRTLNEIMTMAGKGKNNYCCVNQPLIEIDLDHIIVDELHLLLRVVDVQIDNLIDDVLEWDKREDLRKKRKAERGIHLNQLTETIRSCGVSFNIWQKNDDGKSSGKYECTSLLGN